MKNIFTTCLLLISSFNASAQIFLNQTYGGSGNETGHFICATDRGYLVCGGTTTWGPGGQDFLTVLLDKSGNTLGSRVYGGPDNFSNQEYIQHAIQTMDGNIILAGKSKAHGAGSADGYALKINSLGNPIWAGSVGGSQYETFKAVIERPDSSLFWQVNGESWGAAGYDFTLLHTSARGGLINARTYGGSGTDNATRMIMLKDGHILLSGRTTSWGAGSSDLLLLKIHSTTGQVIWGKTYGGPQAEAGPNSSHSGAVSECANGDLWVIS